MKNVKVTLPVRYRGNQIHFGYYRNQAERQATAYLSIQGNTIYFVLNDNLWWFFVSMIAALGLFMMMQAPKAVWSGTPAYVGEVEDAMGFMLEETAQLVDYSAEGVQQVRDNFMVKKQLLITNSLIKHKVSRVDQLAVNDLLALNENISDLFISEVLPGLELPAHVNTYFTAEKPLRKIETALTEQAKYNVPASIKLAQSALETAYGQRVIHNNYFGIKDKKNATKLSETTEYYTFAEYQANKSKVISSKKVNRGGKELYQCRIRDYFAAYQTPWESFRAHSKFLSESKRYAPLFTKGKDYKAWGEKIGSTKYGGVGYATSPIYGEMLVRIIERYQLDLLDH